MYKVQCRKCKVESDWQYGKELPSGWIAVSFSSTASYIGPYHFRELPICPQCKDDFHITYNTPPETKESVMNKLYDLMKDEIQEDISANL